MGDLMDTDLLTKTVICGMGSLAFGIVYKMKAQRLWVVAVGGGAGWFVYSVLFLVTGSVFAGNMGASMFATGYSEIMARRKKAPVVVFLLPCLIPLVPGGSLYYAMNHVVLKDMEKAFEYLSGALEAAMGIAAGIIVLSVVLCWGRSRELLGNHRKGEGRP